MSNRRIPPSNRVPRNTGGERFYQVEEIHVGSWGPLPDGKGPSTQVHVSLRTTLAPYPLVMRFKSAEGLDAFIETLKRHRFDVWPNKEHGL